MNAKALLVHGGGPTAVWNASLVGLALTARRIHGFPKLMAARFGMEGLLREEWVDLDSQPEALLEAVALAPGSAIGSSRAGPGEDGFQRVLEILRRQDVGMVFVSGGNGTMETALRLHETAGGSVQVIGIPKTIDNDIGGTDHTPGYGSVARFFAHAARDAGEDNRSLPSPVMVLETLGRDTGWVTAATALARAREDDAPHLIYLPERRLSLERICGDVEECVWRQGRCVVAVCEGQRDESGEPFGADVQRDRDGERRLASNLGHTLARLIEARTGLRSRSERPGVVGRCFGSLASERDRRDARVCGGAAALAAARGESGCMVALDHEGRTSTVSLTEVVGGVREFPQSWIGPAGEGVHMAYVEWAKPLVGEVPEWAKLPEL